MKKNHELMGSVGAYIPPSMSYLIFEDRDEPWTSYNGSQQVHLVLEPMKLEGWGLVIASRYHGVAGYDPKLVGGPGFGMARY
jgi:hypothetical protein